MIDSIFSNLLPIKKKITVMNTKIREAILEDVPTIAGFQINMALETESMILPPDRINAGVKAVFDDAAKGTYYVCEIDKMIIGSLLITPEWSDWRNNYIWWFQSVYIIPGMRRKGRKSARKDKVAAATAGPTCEVAARTVSSVEFSVDSLL